MSLEQPLKLISLERLLTFSSINEITFSDQKVSRCPRRDDSMKPEFGGSFRLNDVVEPQPFNYSIIPVHTLLKGSADLEINEINMMKSVSIRFLSVIHLWNQDSFKTVKYFRHESY